MGSKGYDNEEENLNALKNEFGNAEKSMARIDKDRRQKKRLDALYAKIEREEKEKAKK